LSLESEPYIQSSMKRYPWDIIVPASGCCSLALEPVLIACDGTWIAHGSAARGSGGRAGSLRVPPDHPTSTLRSCWLSTEEENGYYAGFSTKGLWPYVTSRIRVRYFGRRNGSVPAVQCPAVFWHDSRPRGVGGHPSLPTQFRTITCRCSTNVKKQPGRGVASLHSLAQCEPSASVLGSANSSRSSGA